MPVAQAARARERATKPGYLFDAIVLSQDPRNPAIFGQPGIVTAVFKGGVAVLPHP